MRRDRDHRECDASRPPSRGKHYALALILAESGDSAAPLGRAVRNLPEGSDLAALAEVDIAIIFDEDRPGEAGGWHKGGCRTAVAEVRGGQGSCRIGVCRGLASAAAIASSAGGHVRRCQ